MRNKVAKSYKAMIGTATSGETNSATPDEVVKMYVELMIAALPAVSRAMNVVIGKISP